ncbi:unnamed protein product [Ilex paraguariensis]|uniref:Uncharacterized protein n=1 Tax=Ilex paraguariensis TaxID=185542 RepID=A0ABC8QPW2_9AQUA
MYSTATKSPPPTAPPMYGQPTTGFPVKSANYYPNDNFQGPPQVLPSTPAQWSTGLCDCFSDVPNCCLTCWCPCISFGQIAEIADKGSSSCGVSGALYALIQILTGCGCIYSCVYRSKLRRQYMLPESPCGDFLVHCCCGPCAICQEHRELQNRGFDMSLGWHGNMERQNAGVAMAPAVQGGMYR